MVITMVIIFSFFSFFLLPAGLVRSEFFPKVDQNILFVGIEFPPGTYIDSARSESLKILSDKSRVGYLSLDKYELDIELARSFPADVCKRWCVLPFDRMSKSILVATANPFNQQAAKELAETTQNRLLWYLAEPSELIKNVRKVFR